MRSRKTQKKRNSTEVSIGIGIFEGRVETREYNQAILEVLWDLGSLTAWEIARALQRKLKPVKNKFEAKSNTQGIYSVIQRKKGRLEELQTKGYIKLDKDNKYVLELKGRLALYIQNPEILEKLEAKTQRKAITMMKTQAPTPQNIKAPFGIMIDGEGFKKDYLRVLDKLDDPQYIRLFVKETKQLIKSGIDFDTVSMDVIISLLGLRKEVRKALDPLRRNLLVFI